MDENSLPWSFVRTKHDVLYVSIFPSERARTTKERRHTPAPIMTTLKSAPGSGAGILNISPGAFAVEAIERDAN